MFLQVDPQTGMQPRSQADGPTCCTVQRDRQACNQSSGLAGKQTNSSQCLVCDVSELAAVWVVKRQLVFTLMCSGACGLLGLSDVPVNHRSTQAKHWLVTGIYVFTVRETHSWGVYSFEEFSKHLNRRRTTWISSDVVFYSSLYIWLMLMPASQYSFTGIGR